ncbi:TPA: M48 family metallopeptidase [Methanosarcinaceae archaeon]|nr:M48 family metallopeptidase [Methanosarcinaceae archaeon]
MKANDSIKACGRTIAYEIIYSKRRKSAAIVVRPDLKVEFRAPPGLDSETIRTMVRKKADWVLKKLDGFEGKRNLNPEKRYIDGEKFLYLGEEYPLKLTFGGGVLSAGLEGPVLEVVIPEKVPEPLGPASVRGAVWQWYLGCADEKVGELVEAYSDKMGISPPSFRVKYQKRRWGSCSADNVLRINFQLMMAPPEQLEYVVVHELCHVKEKNHSKNFWALVEELMPDYRVHREGLKKEGWKYVL